MSSLKNTIFWVMTAILTGCCMKDEVEVELHPDDIQFMDRSGYANLHLTAHGRSAISQATDERIRSHAQKIEEQFTLAQQDLEDRARTLRYQLPGEMDSINRTIAQNLMQFNGRSYDSLYLLSQIQILQDLHALYEQRVETNNSGLLGRYAEAWAPQVSARLRDAEDIRDQLDL